MRPHAHRLQQLPQPALSQVSGAVARERLAEREAELLAVGYFHLVFTLRGPIADIAWHNTHREPFRPCRRFGRRSCNDGLAVVQALLATSPSASLLSVRVLSRLFRRLFLQMLVAAHATDQLTFHGDHARLIEAVVGGLGRPPEEDDEQDLFVGGTVLAGHNQRHARLTQRSATTCFRRSLTSPAMDANFGLPTAIIEFRRSRPPVLVESGRAFC